MSHCDRTIYNAREYAIAKGIDLEALSGIAITRIRDTPYVPPGKTVHDVLTSCDLKSEGQTRLKALLRGNRLTDDQWINCATDVLAAKPVLKSIEDLFVEVKTQVDSGAFEVATQRREESGFNCLPSEDELCMTANDEAEYCLPHGFPTSCDLHDPPLRFRPGERYSRTTRRHTTQAEAGYRRQYTDRDIYPGSGCTGCKGHFTQGPVLTDISGTQWWHLKRNDQNEIIRCPGTVTEPSTSVSARPEPKLPRVSSGFAKMIDQRSMIPVHS